MPGSGWDGSWSPGWDGSAESTTESTTELSPSTVFDQVMAGTFDMTLELWGETVTYYPHEGTPRSIKAVVDREVPSDISGSPAGNAPVFLVLVKNDGTYGVSSAELDIGADKIALARRLGRSASSRRIVSVQYQDYGALELVVQ